MMNARLQPICDAIDEEQYEKAIKICNKALGNVMNRDVDSLKSLKSLALCRSGNFQQAYDLVMQVKRNSPIEPFGLQFCFLTLKMLQLHDEIIDLYGNAFTQIPTNEEYANNWFMGLARKGEWKELQIAAVKINRQFKQDKYYFWIVISIHLQSRDSNCTNSNLLLTLAERMMQKSLKDSQRQVGDFEVLQLYLNILSDLKLYKKSLDLIANLAHLYKIEHGHQKACMTINFSLENYAEVIVISKSILLIDPNEWDCHLALLSALKNQDQPVDTETEMRFYKMLQKKTSTGPKTMRGPYLGELYFLKQNCQYTFLADSIIEYVCLFGSTMSCYTDLHVIIDSVPVSSATKLVADLLAFLDQKLDNCEDSSNNHKNIDLIRLNINVLKLIRYFRRKFCLEENAIACIASLFELYDTSIKITVNDERERQYGDEYLILASHYALDSFMLDRMDRNGLYHAIVILEHALSKSKYNYVIKIILVRLYFEIGVHHRSLEIAASLEIKQIQLDTLSYIYTSDLELFGNIHDSLIKLSDSLDIYDRNQIETPEMILQAFRYGTFSKIPELIDFKRCVHYSIQRAIANRQIIRLSLLDCDSSKSAFAKVEAIELDDLSIDKGCPILDVNILSDQRDISLVAKYVPGLDDFLSRIRGTEFPVKEHANQWLKLNSLIPLVLVQIIKPEKNSSYATKLKDLEDFIKILPDSESMACRIIAEFMAGQPDTVKVARLLDELQVSWNEIETILDKDCTLSLDLCKMITQVIECWNILAILSVFSKIKAAKPIMLKQLRKSKKYLSRFSNDLSNESIGLLRQKLLMNSLPGTEIVPVVITNIQSGWISVLAGFNSMLDGRIGIVNDIK